MNRRKVYLFRIFRVFIFMLYFEVGERGEEGSNIYIWVYDVYRILFTWQLQVDYSAIGVYMNMLFVVNSFTKFSTNIVDEFFCCILFYCTLYQYFTFSVYAVFICTCTICLKMLNAYTWYTCILFVVLFHMLSVHVLITGTKSIIAFLFFCLQVTFIELYTSITAVNDDELEN